MEFLKNLKYKNLFEDLYVINRSLLGSENNKALARINREYPVVVHTFDSGESVGDWVIPDEWVLHNASLTDDHGNIICTTKESVLRVVNYSESVDQELSLKQLLKHIHTSKVLPNSYPYRTSYYKKQWGFCLTKNEKDNLRSDRIYRAQIKTEFKKSKMSVGEIYLAGETKEEILLTSYICHPAQAHDGLSGVICLLYVYDMLKAIKNRKYSYRFLFTPETIGTIAMIQKRLNLEKIKFCLVSTCCGMKSEPVFKETYLKNHAIDNILNKIILNRKQFIPIGSDERQYSSPNIRIPTAVIATKMYSEFEEYHTSEDSIDKIDYNTIRYIAGKYAKALLDYENRICYKMNHIGCEPFLTKYDLYRTVGGVTDVNDDLARNWVLFLSDGEHDILDMSVKSELPIELLSKHTNILLKASVIREIK